MRKYFRPPFSLESSRHLKLFWAGLLVQGLERASQAFSHDGFLRVIKREYPAGQESPAQILDKGMFWACRVRNRRVCGFFLLLPMLFEEGLPFLNSLKIASFVSRERIFL